jgi:hypothetical protein
VLVALTGDHVVAAEGAKSWTAVIARNIAPNALCELGGVFGVAVLASVFARHGVYTSPTPFADGFTAALWAGATFSAIGALMALPATRRPHT